MVKFSPIALNFGYDFVLFVHLLGHPVNADFQCLKVTKNVGDFEPKLLNRIVQRPIMPHTL